MDKLLGWTASSLWSWQKKESPGNAHIMQDSEITNGKLSNKN